MAIMEILDGKKQQRNGISYAQSSRKLEDSYMFPEKALFGPVTKAKAYRTFAIYVSTVVIGNLIWALSNSSWCKFSKLG